MTEHLLRPKPLLDSAGTSPQVRRLLALAPTPTPLDDERRRQGRLALARAPRVNRPRLGTWVLCGAVLVGGAVAVAHVLRSSASAPSVAAPRGVASPAQPTSPSPSAVTDEVSPPRLPITELAPPATKAAKSGAKARDVSLEAELQALRAARELLATDPSRALALSRAHTASFPAAKLQTEATLLEIEALVRLGRKDEATRAGRRLMASAGAGLYRERVESLLGERTIP